MNEAIKMDTWDALRDLGFQPDDKVISDARPGLGYDFGNIKLCANWVLNLRFTEVVLFTGVLTSRRSGAEVIFEMPRLIESRELCAAWIVYNLDKYSDNRTFTPLRNVEWVLEGRKNLNILSLEKKRAELMRQQEVINTHKPCTVEREWIKLALKSLEKYLKEVEDTEPVEISFDGKALSFKVGKNNVIITAEGSPWKTAFSLPAGKLRQLPKRFTKSYIYVSVDVPFLRIDRYRYDRVVELEKVNT